LPRWEPRDPCDEWYLAGHLVGAERDCKEAKKKQIKNKNKK